MHDDRVIRWPPFGGVNFRYGLRIFRVGAKAVDGFRGKGNKLALFQLARRRLDCRQIQGHISHVEVSGRDAENMACNKQVCLCFGQGGSDKRHMPHFATAPCVILAIQVQIGAWQR